uniref:Truncated envelope glycoprotein n=1 Tax=Human immunodeficiency virus type 1 TaxID=11676 RepID=A0A0H3YA49_HV1|nr:truncated envelope glycoprotein [Human immunodeficiency virus 1]
MKVKKILKNYPQ